MNIRTIQDRVIVEVEFSEDVSSTGIFLGEGEAKNEGTVLVTGLGKDHGMSVKVGDRVIIDPSMGQKIQIAGKKLLVLREDDIFAVVGE